ncbi:TonB-dependent receptor domain-containing protein [Sphingomonas oligoaromativorans]|uniref:TonB-dependent receptor n=1 Tax=Sphingomonas oligoaromativorans TaxID=575322 RepID=UPI0014215064|nr:iron complex outermembrane receptor protein [Sphingomonas oligoaromativorans]
MSKIFIRPAALAAVASCAMIAATSAFAQDAAAAAPAAGNELGDIVVTAERRAENLQKVPISVGVINGAGLRDFQAGGDDTLLSLSGKVPSLYVESTTGRIFPRFYIRGLGNIDFYLGASQPVSIIQDDVVLEHVVLKSNPAFDIQQVEVLRGPQGSLFGRNTTAGIIKFDTVKPTQDFEARGTASYGSYNTVNIDAGVGGPIIADKLAFRVSALYQHRDNWVDNGFTGVSDDGTRAPRKDALGGFDEKDVRLQFLLTPTERLSILASGHARDYEGTSTIFYRGSIIKGTNAVPSNFDRSQVALDEGDNNPQHYWTYGGSLNVGYDFGGVKLTSISAYETSHGYSRGDTDGGAAINFPGPAFFGESQGRLRSLGQFTEEVRLASDGTDRFKWQVGGIYFDSRDDTEFDQRAFFLNPGVAARNPNNWVLLHDINTSWGIFGQASYKLTDRLTITGGVRETKDTKSTRLLKTANTAAGAVTYTGRRYVRLSDTRPSWDASALYELTPNVSLYGRIARGFRGPTIQGRSAVFNSDFTTANSETNTSYEGGIKSSFLDNRVRLNLTGFTYVVDNIQLNGNDSNGNGVLFNANKAKAYGMEAEAEVKPIPNLTLSAGLSLLHTEIDDKNVYAQVCGLAIAGVYNVVCTVQNPTITKPVFGTPTVFAQIDGNPLPNAPKYNLDLTARYDLPIGEGKAFISTDWNIQGDTSFVPYKTKEFTSKGSFEGGLKIGYDLKSYEVAVFARNITNEKNLKGVIDNYMAGVYNDPRIIGVSVSARFH